MKKTPGRSSGRPLLTPDEVRLLDRLMLGGRAAPIASAAGVRRARTRGAGAEFHEYRHYQPGDDPRSIDWTVEARLQQLVVRVSRAEGHVALHALVDVSASMCIGSPTKLEAAARGAAALCYLAVEARDTAGVATFSHRMHACVRPAAGRIQLSRIFDVLSDAAPGGASSLDRALEQYAGIARGPGLVMVLSDWLDEGFGAAGLQALLHRGLTPAIVQVLAPEEIDPAIEDGTELHDAEEDGADPLVADAGSVDTYRQRLEQHTQALRELCLSRGLPFMRIVAGASLPDLVTGFEAAGVVAA